MRDDAINIIRTDKVNNIQSFIKDFLQLTLSKLPDKKVQISNFLNEYREITQISASTADLNVLDLAGVGNDEVKHSSILAWLLDPRSRHACTTIFLRTFLESAGIELDEEVLRTSYVRTEFYGSESIIDIFIASPNQFLVYIENKTLSPEGDDQVDREYRDLQRLGDSLRIPNENRYPIFLTPSGRSPISGNPKPWHTVSYYDLDREIDDILPQINNSKVAFLIEDLIAVYRRWSRV